MDQTTINFVLSALSALMGFVLKMVWDSVKDLQRADTSLAARVGEIEVLVAGRYVTNERLDQSINALSVKLDKIDAKIDRKMDKC